ncbi:MAG: MarR family EPS-associated transcriptional regulator [Syntrophorhabdaceae bacterium]|nr:MarR family EPS-associated transcriptional regulator [Syntrophorhabdales bacterium]MBP9561440.1 MarR family EPS-associated transcriptional regulator [Syntrophorhabdaceae bacterium]
MKDSEFYILRELSLNNSLTQRELSNRLGLSLGGVNYVLKALIKKGYIKMQKFKDSDNKARYIYMLTPKWAYEKIKLTSSFISSKIVEYETLQREIEELKKDIE